MFLPLPSVDYLRSILSYNPQDGELGWRVDYVRFVAGTRAGNIQSGQVRIDGRLYKMSRIIWKMMTGEDPPTIVDHEDRNERNNSWSNLRLATSAQNCANCGRQGRQRALPRGVYMYGLKFAVRLSGNRDFGAYDTLEEAVAVAEQERTKTYGEFARHD